MHNDGRMFTQVAAAAGVAAEQAAIACYMLNLSRAGRSLDDAATLLKITRPEARDHARSWSIEFSDYQTSPAPVVAQWTKEKRGRWILTLADRIIAEAESDGGGGYHARTVGDRSWRWSGSRAEVAIKRASRAIEREADRLFSAEDVEILGPTPDGTVARLAPVDVGARTKLASALHSAPAS